ncbi:hypothetical protein F5X97DRAFT_315343 [Nemania serpens]|nr:hypothetical protein F5X97DRAFT_315343 [Nemania serpens]
MAPLNLYLAYKRDTSRLIFWIIKASNAIIASSATLPDDVPRTPNTNGEITVSSLVSLSKLIAKHISPIPSAVLAVFDSAIRARTATHQAFQQLVADQSDPEVERSNDSHKHFIDSLVEAFEALGGAAWAEKCKPDGPPNEDDLEQALFTNKFSILAIDGDTAQEDEGASDDGSDLEPQRPQASQRRQKQKKSSGKGKKGKNGKNANKKKKKQHLPSTETQSIDDVPVESYRVIQDEEWAVTDYMVAVYALVQECAELRAYLQGQWREVAYDGLNSAIVGALSNIAVTRVERSAIAMFIDFPGHDSYETVMRTITSGDPDKAQGKFYLSHHSISSDKTSTRMVQESAIDVKEQFLIHAYQDLIDFVADFQKTRSGKPTKRMLAQISNWDPNLDLRSASIAERLKWRRAYTINWLYDLVNVFSYIVVQHNTKPGEQHALESVDWSTSGPWGMSRRLFGLTNFAGVITHLAMQKSGSDIRHEILPHHVFQLQCIVDSFTVSRGWSLSGLRGHVLRAPPRGFRPRRDVDLFLDRESRRPGTGFLQAVEVLKRLFEKDKALHDDISYHEARITVLKVIQREFSNCLGESMYMMDEPTNIPPSRFSTTNSNGLWDYSPFLCGVGLEEGLVEAYRYSFMVLDTFPEPVLLVHLHNMLVLKGYITKPVGLYASLQELFRTAFFIDGRVPTSNFGKAFLARAFISRSRRPKTRHTIDDAKDFRSAKFFKTKSFLMVCHGAGWNPDRISDSDIPLPSLFGYYRIGQTKHIVDPITGQKKMADTDLVNRARASGHSEEDLMRFASVSANQAGEHQLTEAAREMLVTDEGQMSNRPDLGGKGGKDKLSTDDLISMLKEDISNDIWGDMPLSSLNYVWTMARCMLLFHELERELGKLRNPLYVQAYETDPTWRHSKRAGLVYLALQVQDKQCLEVMAREFQNPRAAFMDHIYWEDLESVQLHGKRPKTSRVDDSSDQCSVM